MAVGSGTIAVGAPGANGGAGAVLVFAEPQVGVWSNATQTAVLTAGEPGRVGFGGLGASVASSASGTMIVAGLAADASASTEPSDGWQDATQTATLSGGMSTGSVSIAADGATAVVGEEIFDEPSAGWQSESPVGNGGFSQGSAAVGPDGLAIGLGNRTCGMNEAWWFMAPWSTAPLANGYASECYSGTVGSFGPSALLDEHDTRCRISGGWFDRRRVCVALSTARYPAELSNPVSRPHVQRRYQSVCQ